MVLLLNFVLFTGPTLTGGHMALADRLALRGTA